MTLPDTTPRALVKTLPGPVREIAAMALDHIQYGYFQRSMALLVAGSSLVSTIEVGYEHYKGSYSNPVMYTPVTLGAALTLASTAAVARLRRGAPERESPYSAFPRPCGDKFDVGRQGLHLEDDVRQQRRRDVRAPPRAVEEDRHVADLDEVTGRREQRDGAVRTDVDPKDARAHDSIPASIS